MAAPSVNQEFLLVLPGTIVYFPLEGCLIRVEKCLDYTKTKYLFNDINENN
jgi:hypothetical protein